jgi:hypothetical protein
MRFDIPIHNAPMTILATVENNTPNPIVMCVVAFDPNKVDKNGRPNTFYYKRKVKIDKKFPFDLKFPLTPKVLSIAIYNESNGLRQNDPSFKVTRFEPAPLKTHDLWMSQKDHSFINFAKQFAENASILSSGVRKPAIYRSNDAKFEIDYYDQIRDRKTGKPVNTPARIGHKSGIIEVSKKDFIKYTVPMRMIILLHEYSHKWKNGDIGRPIEDETAADINALSMYLSMGFSEVEAQKAFLTVFKGANNAANERRMKILSKFVKDFNEGKLGNKSTSYRFVGRQN